MTNKLSEKTRNDIKLYLDTKNESLIDEIKINLNEHFKIDEEGKQKIKKKIEETERYMISYSEEDGTTYIPGSSLLKIVMKNIILDTMCNVFVTAETSDLVINEMGSIIEVTDMLKAGIASGALTAFGYFFAVIILFIMGLLNMF